MTIGNGKKQSYVWNHYKLDGPEIAICNYCDESLSCKKSSTSALGNHLLRVHFISKETKTEILNNTSKITKYLKKETLPEILSRLAAEDGFSILGLLIYTNYI